MIEAACEPLGARAAGPHPRGAARAPGEDQRRALFLRVAGRRRSVKLLLERGANAEIADRDGRTLVEIARERSTPEITGLLRPSRA